MLNGILNNPEEPTVENEGRCDLEKEEVKSDARGKKNKANEWVERKGSGFDRRGVSLFLFFSFLFNFQ